MYDNLSPEGIKAEILKKLDSLDTREGSYTDSLVSPVAYELWKYYMALNSMIPVMFVDETSGQYIDKRSGEFGIYRKPGTKAAAVLDCTGTNGVMIPKDKVFLTPGGLEFRVKEGAVIAEGKASVTLESAGIGEQYNVSAGEISRQTAPLYGLKTYTNRPAAGGMDEETDQSLLTRLYDHLQKPSTSGNAFHYKEWAKETKGVGEARVFPVWNGAGTVKVVISDQNYQPASAEIVEACRQHIEECRPIGAAVTVVSAKKLAVTIKAVIRIEAKTTLEAVKEAFSKAVEEYFESITFQSDEVIYNRIAYILLNIDGVRDYHGLTINGATGNIPISAEQIPYLEGVTVEDVTG